MKFKEDFSENERLLESKKILSKYPNRVPIIVEKHDSCEFGDIKKKKYLVPRDMYMKEFAFVIRKKVSLSSGQSMFIMSNNRVLPSMNRMGEIYETSCDTDGFLYMNYSSEHTFG